MKIKRLIGGSLESNGYVIYQQEGDTAYIIDPGYQPNRFIKIVKELELEILGILLTHHHSDHVGGVEKLRKELGCPVYMHRQDADYYKKQVDVLLSGGEILPLGQEEILVLHTPGHTPGGVCFYSEKSKLVFTGDTVFDEDLGRTDLEGGDEGAMENSIRQVVNQWGNEITIYPGHGESVNMAHVRKYNQEFLDCLTD